MELPLIVGTDPDGRELFVVQGEHERYDAIRSRSFDEWIRQMEYASSLRRFNAALGHYESGGDVPKWTPPPLGTPVQREAERKHKTTWKFPDEPFIGYQPSDAPWCRYFGFGFETGELSML